MMCICIGGSGIKHINASDTASDTFTEGNITYLILDKDSVEVKKYDGQEKNLEIPEEVDGFKVVSIASAAFYANQCIKTVHLPESIEYIGDEAFAFCSNLTKINIPVTSGKNIGTHTFYEDKKLTDVQGGEYLEDAIQAFINTPLQSKKFAKEIATATVSIFVALICFLGIVVYAKKLLCE
jgi:hypothetical protein